MIDKALRIRETTTQRLAEGVREVLSTADLADVRIDKNPAAKFGAKGGKNGQSQSREARQKERHPRGGQSSCR